MAKALDRQARHIKRALDELGVAIDPDSDPGDQLDRLQVERDFRARIADKFEIWIADGVLTRKEATAMKPHERKTFYFRQRAIERYEESD